MVKNLLLLITLLFMNQANAQNLVLNGSAELFDAATHAPANWNGNNLWQSSLAGAGLVDTVTDGQYFFYASGSAQDTLWQDVDVSSYSSAIDASGQYFSFSALVQCFPQGYGSSDQSRCIVQCFNSAKTVVLHTYDSDTISSMGVWLRIFNSFLAPTGTRFVRIKLAANRRSGFANDGYFDAISLVPGNNSGINNALNNFAVNIFPNPAGDEFSVTNARGGALTITDIAGHQVYNASVLSADQTYNIAFLKQGMYFVQVMDNGKTKMEKLVKN